MTNYPSGKCIFGLSWSFHVPFIQRKTDKQLPKYEDANESDVSLFSGVEDQNAFPDNVFSFCIYLNNKNYGLKNKTE